MCVLVPFPINPVTDSKRTPPTLVVSPNWIMLIIHYRDPKYNRFTKIPSFQVSTNSGDQSDGNQIGMQDTHEGSGV